MTTGKRPLELEVEALIESLRLVRNTVVVSTAALRQQGCDCDEEIAAVLEVHVGRAVDDGIARMRHLCKGLRRAAAASGAASARSAAKRSAAAPA